MSADVEAIYKNSTAVLWVEDPETRAWLDAVWSGLAPTIRVLVAGGRENVKTICEQAVAAVPRNSRSHPYRRIFGLVDMDFGTSNRHRWKLLQSHERVYRLDVHEFENLLLDPNVLANCNLNTGRRTALDIGVRIEAAAKERVFWVACTRFLSQVSRAAKCGFPPDPGVIGSLADAEAYVTKSDWFNTTAHACPGLATPTAVSAGLQAAHNEAMAALADGSWRTLFPGKEIFNEIGSHVHPNGNKIDLVKAIGKFQSDSNGVPSQATDLRDVILARVSSL